jgi:acetolactate synthase-1/2/3 large subunit
VDQLKIHGVDEVFCVPGESYLAVLDALYDRPEISLIVCRQEGGAAMMADAYGKLTGRPGICLVTRGPGATNASVGVHTAHQDSTPMILFVGQVGRPMQDREAFQEIDFRRMFGQMTKWVAQVDDAARLPEYVSRAFFTATSGRPGPVVLALPEDMLRDFVAIENATSYQIIQTYPGHQDVEGVKKLLSEARRPLVILGGGGWDAATCANIQAFAERSNLPVGSAFRCQDYFPNNHSNYVGHIGIGINPKLAQRVKEADLLLVIGARLGEMTTRGYSLLEVPRPRQRLIHVYPDAEELGRVYQPYLPINASVATFAEQVARLPQRSSLAWGNWTRSAREDYLHHIQPPREPGDLQLGKIMAWLVERLPPNTIVTNGAGNYTVWVHRFYQYRHYPSQLAPTAGAMGYGTPAAIAAKTLYPDRMVISFSGDGCFLMNGQELATAVQYGLNIIVLVINNRMYGTIRMHQERQYPGRPSGTDLINPDFAALAQAYGAFGEVVSRNEEFAPAFERAVAANKPALLELRLDPEAITPNASLSEI